MFKAMFRALGAGCLCIAIAVAALAQPVPSQVSDRSESLAWLVGSWRGAGTMFGRASEATLDLRPALGGRFVELSYRAGGFEGRAFYRPAGERRWQATWFDNRGFTFPIAAVAGDRTLTADWGSAETERGRTVYRLAEDGRLHVVDSVAGADGDWREFARHVLHKAD